MDPFPLEATWAKLLLCDMIYLDPKAPLQCKIKVPLALGFFLHSGDSFFQILKVNLLDSLILFFFSFFPEWRSGSVKIYRQQWKVGGFMPCSTHRHLAESV